MASDNLLIKSAIDKLSNSYAPYSKFNVSSVIVTENDEIYFGVNVENASYGLTICAERSAIANMVANSKMHKIKKVIVLSKAKIKTPPCGACRQVISEFATEDCQVILPHGENYDEILQVSAKELMPFGFEL